MADAKRGTEIATIDVVLVTLRPQDAGATEIAIDTSSNVAVEPQIETTEAVKLIIKGVLKAQKPGKNTITGNTITLTDNVFTPEVAAIVEGGTILHDNLDDPNEITGYLPPPTGSDPSDVPPFDMFCYTAQYNASGQIVKYEQIKYPNCQGQPIGVGAEDGVFRVNEYTINSYPNQGQSPFEIHYVDELPAVITTSRINPNSATYVENTDLEVSVAYNGNTLSQITLGTGEPLTPGTDYKVEGSKVTFISTYLTTALQPGKNLFTFTFTAGDPAIFTVTK